MAHLAKYQSSSGDTERKLSPGIWGNCPVEEILKYKTGYFFFEDFAHLPAVADAASADLSGNLGNFEYFIEQSAGALFAISDAALPGGVATFTHDTDNEDVSIGPNYTPFKITTGSGQPLWFEARLKTSTIADTKHGFVVGLVESGAVATVGLLTTAGALADKNFIGFHRLEGDGDKLDIVYKADGQTAQTALADAVTLVADTFVKVGFYFDGYNTIKFYKDGVPVKNSSDSEQIISNTNMDAVTFPDDITLGVCFGLMNATSSTPGSTSLDWIACAQVY